MNLTQLTAQTALLAGDPQQSRYAANYTDALNAAQKQWCFDSKSLYEDAPTYTVVDGTAAYSLPTDFLVERVVTHKGLKLTPITRAQLLAQSGDDWTDDTGTPTNFIIDPEEARKTITLYPIPQADDAGANLILTYYPIPDDMANATDTPLNGSTLLAPYHIAICAWAAWLLLQSEIATPEALAKQANLLKQYNDKVIDAIDKFGNTKSAKMNLSIQGRVGFGRL